MGRNAGPPLAAFLLASILLLNHSPATAQEGPAYLALGDSLAFGVGATNPAAEGYVGLTHFGLESSSSFAGSGLELVNVSEPGATSGDLLVTDGQLEKALREIQERAEDDVEDNEVELISLDIGGNDLLQLAEPDSPCILDTGSTACRQGISAMLSGLETNLEIILTRLTDAAPEAEVYVLDLYNPYSGTGDQREVIADFAVQQVNGVITATASGPAFRTVGLVTIFELFEDRGQQWIASDGIHPNDAGHRVMAEALLAAIEERPVEVPTDLASAPTDPADDRPGSGAITDDGGDGPPWLMIIGISVAFFAGMAVSSTYFWVRGRR
jgi:lysophospholipase L1-like esterase